MRKRKQKRCRKLTRIEMVKLYGWVKKHKGEARTMDAKALAPMASKDLGFPVTVCQLNGMRKEMGLSPSPGKKPKATVDHGALKVIARELIEIRENLNLPISAYLVSLAK